MERKAFWSSGKTYPSQSYFTIPADEVVRLVEANVGKGEPVHGDEGDWYRKEKCRAGRTIGRAVTASGKEVETEWFIIHYSDKKGVHAVPATPPKE